MMHRRFCQLLLLCGLMFGLAEAARAGDFVPSAARGYQLLTTKPYLPADFDQEVFDELWKVWPKELREQAKQATPAEIRRLAFERYGLMESPDHPGQGTAWGHTSDGRGG